jgi:hypothetical protein
VNGDRSNNRRDVRHPARVLVRLNRSSRGKAESVDLFTQDVSFRGAFVRTDAPPALRQLVKVSFQLPGGQVVSGHAMVVHRVEPGPGDVPGMGVQFWGQLDGARAWESFVREVAQQVGPQRASLAPPAASSTDTPDKVRRASERFRLQIDVVLDGKTLRTRDVSETGLSVRTDLPVPVGAKARLQLLANGAEPVAVLVVVRSQIVEPGLIGLGLVYVEINEQTRAAVIDFVRGHAPPEDAEFVSPGDPRLL